MYDDIYINNDIYIMVYLNLMIYIFVLYIFNGIHIYI